METETQRIDRERIEHLRKEMFRRKSRKEKKGRIATVREAAERSVVCVFNLKTRTLEYRRIIQNDDGVCARYELEKDEKVWGDMGCSMPCLILE